MANVMSGRALDRMINFSDAVVAVAITVLVLPIIDIEGPGPQQTMIDVLSANSGQLLAFVVTFFIVFLLWQGHHRVFGNLSSIDTPIVWLNALWLITIAFLPWPSRLVDIGSNESGAVWLYCATLFLSALMLHLIYMRGRSHPSLLVDPAAWAPWFSASLLFASVFGAMTLVALFNPQAALWLLLLATPGRILHNRVAGRAGSAP